MYLSVLGIRQGKGYDYRTVKFTRRKVIPPYTTSALRKHTFILVARRNPIASA